MARWSLCAFALGAGLLVGLPMPLVAQIARQEEPRPARPVGFEVAYEWQYSCPEAKGCSFTCPGSGGATNVINLSLYLGSLSLASTQNTAAVFYEFSTRHIPKGNGFAVTTGIGTLSCQVQGMQLNFSGPAGKPKASDDIPTASITSSPRP
jgi:hypothetical protein